MHFAKHPAGTIYALLKCLVPKKQANQNISYTLSVVVLRL